MKKTKQLSTDSLQKELLPFISDYHNNPTNHLAIDALKTQILKICYRARTSDGDFSGGKTGSLAFNINPSSKNNPDSKAQTELFQKIMSAVNNQLARMSEPPQPQTTFTWEGSTVFQIKKDPTKTTNIIREELNDNTSELLVSSLSEALADSEFTPLAKHPDAFCFADASDDVIIASQYLPNTIGTLSDFVKKCIETLQESDKIEELKHRERDSQLSINIDHLAEKYKSFSLKDGQDIAIVDDIKSFSPSLVDQSAPVSVSDLDHLATLYMLNQENRPAKQDMVPLTKALLQEISFSHAIADHDVNPGNFVVRLNDQQLSLSRIDFGMANYHFTRGRIFGISRRPFSNLFRDIHKESFMDFVARRNIGFGLMSPFLVKSKTFIHLTGIKNLLEHPQTDAQRELVKNICNENIQLHKILGNTETQQLIQKRFLSKVKNLPHKAQLDILRDLKIMEMQSIRQSYLNFQTPKDALHSSLKLLGMLTLTPFLATLRLIASPIVLLFKYTPLRFNNPFPLSTWTLLQKNELKHTLRGASEPLLCQQCIGTCLQKLLTQVVSENKEPSDPLKFKTDPERPVAAAGLGGIRKIEMVPNAKKPTPQHPGPNSGNKNNQPKKGS